MQVFCHGLSYLGRVFLTFNRNMSSVSILTPIGVRGMKSLDREKFSREILVPVVKVSESKLSKVSQVCRSYFLKLENFKPVQNSLNSNEPHNKCLYLNPEKVDSWNDLLENDVDLLLQNGVDENEFFKEKVQLSYENWKYETIFKAVLPENEDIVSGFSQIGHIIHLNLRDHLLEYKSLIGQVLVDKIKTCRTVVNKSNTIDNTYRNFSMEVLAGEEDFTVSVKENLCNFQFDFSKVYWNPRLCKEHERILSYLKPGDVLFDVFCGVGPFAIPAAKRKILVYANDLNPESFKWLNHNAEKNKINNYFFHSYNQDGKDFICNVFKDYIIKYYKDEVTLKDGAKIHITMNLPAMAVEFLKYFKGLIKNMDWKEKFDLDITIYVYCFALGDDAVNEAKKMVNENFGMDMSKYISDVFIVRNVAPKKEMVRVTIHLTKEVIFDVNSDVDCEPPMKKVCLENKE